MEDNNFKQSEAYDLGKTDLDFLASLAMSDSMQFGFPPVFKTIWALLLSKVFLKRDFTQLALGLPRGFGKTTLIKLLIAYCVLYTDKKFILVTAATATLAQNIVSDVFDMLDEQNIKSVFGDWRLGIEKDTQEIKKFGFRGRNIIVAAIGQGGSVRGLNIKNSRPDVIIFEDIQSREDADSQEVSERIERWMVGTAMKAKAFDGCLFLFIANMYPTKWSMLRRIKKNLSWIKFIAGGILADGTSLWEDLQPISQLLAEFESDKNAGHPEIFYAEVLNDENASANNNIDLSKLPEYPFEDDELSVGSYIIVDPSNDKANSDAVAIGQFDILGGLPVLGELRVGRFSPTNTVEEAIKLAMETGVSLIAVEAVAYQYSLCHWFERALEALRVSHIKVVPIYPGKKNKNSRILEMFKGLVAGEIFLSPKVLPEVSSQIVQFNPLKTNNVDDILDLLTYSPRVIEEFGYLISVTTAFTVASQEDSSVLGVEDNSSF